MDISNGFRDIRSYEDGVRQLQTSDHWLTRPIEVTIETYALCNAACTFCPYPSLDRKGQRMPTELVHKIVNDLAEADGPQVAVMSLSRVNEPLLDRRYFDFCDYVADHLAGTGLRHFTNATPLTEANLDRLLALPNTASVKVSFNDHRKKQYEATMAISYETALSNVERLHERAETGDVGFPVRLGRVGDGSAADVEFIAWVRERFPRFEPLVTPRFDWLGSVDVATVGAIPEVGCTQWFQLNFLADGRAAFCCIDSDGAHGSGDAAKQNVLDIYNSPARRRLREQALHRKKVDLCQGCNALV